MAKGKEFPGEYIIEITLHGKKIHLILLQEAQFERLILRDLNTVLFALGLASE
jgi:hypothetical protein